MPRRCDDDNPGSSNVRARCRAARCQSKKVDSNFESVLLSDFPTLPQLRMSPAWHSWLTHVTVVTRQAKNEL